RTRVEGGEAHEGCPGRGDALRPGGLATRHYLRGPAGAGPRRRHLHRPAGPPPAPYPQSPPHPPAGPSGHARLRLLVHRHQRRRVHPRQTAAHEAWHRMRTDIEDRIRDAKHGAALRHLPSANRTVNTIWMWAALLAVNLSAGLQELTGL